MVGRAHDPNEQKRVILLDAPVEPPVAPSLLDPATLALVLEATPTPLWVIGPDGTVQLANVAALTALGYRSVGDVIGSPSHAMLHDHRPDGSAYPSEACPILDGPGPGPTTAPEWFIARDGRPLPVAWTVRPLGGTGSRLLSFRDISDALTSAEPTRRRAVGLGVPHGHSAGPVRATGSERDEVRAALLERIRARHQDPEFTVAVLATEMHMSVRAIQLLLAERGLSPASEIRRARLEAARLLLSAGHSVTAAAHASGFSDAGTFGRAFRRHFGEPPGGWARRAV